MGDFNDEPFSRSVREYALAADSETKLIEANEAPRLLNLMWPFPGKGLGTHYDDNFPNVFDQVWISRGVITGASGFTVKKGAVKIKMFRDMVASEVNERIKFPRPIRFGRPSNGSLNRDGYSDHYPISTILQEL